MPIPQLRRKAVFAHAAAVVLLVSGSAPLAQRGASGGEWRHYGGDAGGTKYSPLDHINKDNVRIGRSTGAIARSWTC